MDDTTTRKNLVGACRLLALAEEKLLTAREVVEGVPPPAYGTRDVRFDALKEAAQEVEDQRRNVDCCAYFHYRAQLR
jgi:hypothetical protein